MMRKYSINHKLAPSLNTGCCCVTAEIIQNTIYNYNMRTCSILLFF